MPYQTANNKGTGDILKKGAAEYQSWMQLTQSQANTIKGLEGANYATSSDPLAERYAQLVYVINQSAGGAATSAIADGVDDTLFATVADLTNSNPLVTMIVDANGDQITSFGGSSIKILGDDDTTEATVSDLANSNALHTLLVDANGDQITSFGSSAIAETGTPTPVADGAAVNPWYDAYGRQVLAGYNVALAAMDVNLVNDSLTSKLGPVTNLSAVTANTDGSAIDVSSYHNITVHITSASVTDGATFSVESSLDNTNWVELDSAVIGANETSEYSYTNVAYKYVRTRITSRTDGTYTSKVYAGN